MSKSVRPAPQMSLNMSLSDTTVSMPDLTVTMSALSSRAASPSWSSVIEDHDDRTIVAGGRPRRYGQKGRLPDTLVRGLGSDIVATAQGDIHTNRVTLKRADTFLAYPAVSVSHTSRYDVETPTSVIPTSARDSCESSVPSSGIPGVGYYSGKALKWLGERGLDAVAGVIILRRTYHHLARLKRWKKQGRTGITVNYQPKLFGMLEDALEMSRPCYSSLVNKAAATIARAVDDWIVDQFPGPNTKETDALLSQIHVCLSPMRLARSHDHGSKPSNDLFRELLHTVTKVPLSLQLQDTKTTSTVILMLARELAHSQYGTHHRWLGESLRRIVKQTQQTRPLTAEEMSALCDIASCRFQRTEEGEYCRPWEVVLFAECASQSQWCTDVVRGPSGLRSLVVSLEITGAKPMSVSIRDEEWFNADDILASLLSLSRHGWLENSFASMPGLVGLLLRVLGRGTHERRFRSCTCIVFTLRNLAHQSTKLHTPEAINVLEGLATAAKTRRSSSNEEYYRKIVCRYTRDLLEDAKESSAAASGFTSEVEG